MSDVAVVLLQKKKVDSQSMQLHLLVLSVLRLQFQDAILQRARHDRLGWPLLPLVLHLLVPGSSSSFHHVFRLRTMERARTDKRQVKKENEKETEEKLI